VLDGAGVLELRAVRHPLLHPQCVPVDVRLEPGASIIIITGPNAGGKTVLLKTVGVNVLLALCGCYVLAQRDGRVPVFAEILADIGDAQSIEAHLSTFTSHLSRLGEILKQAGERTLVLLDEVGVGTDPIEGAALATGVVKYLRSRRAYALATSHYEALKRLGFTEAGVQNGSMEFDDQTHRPTYRFLLGVSGRSNALHVAREFALPEVVLAEMTAVLQGAGGEEGELVAALERERLAVERLRRDLDERQRALVAEHRELTEERHRLTEFRKKRRDALSERIESELDGQVKAFEALIRDLRTQPVTDPAAAVADARAGLAAAKEARGQLETLTAQLTLDGAESSRTEDTPPPVVGDAVRWANLAGVGKLISANVVRDRAVVEIDDKQLIVPYSQLRRANRADRRAGASGHGAADEGDGAETAPRGGTVVAPVRPVRDELDLRGMRVEEAIEAVGTYLPQAETGGFGKVRLIHGKGTGALWRAVTEYLKQSRWRNQFRLGRYGEGDLGVTVVVFDPAADRHETGPGALTGTSAKPATGRKTAGRPRRRQGE